MFINKTYVIKLIILLLNITIYKSNCQEPTEQEDDCVCVPYYQCEDGKVITTGEGILDIRIKTCSGIEVCCQLPGTDGGNTGEIGVIQTEPPIVVTPEPTPQTGGEEIRDRTGPPLPTISEGEGCGRKRYSGQPNAADNALRITGLLGYPEETFYGEVPWMVRLMHLNNGQINDTFLMCGGALITPSVVLTAAHCVYKLNTNELLVRAGDWNIQMQHEPKPPQDKKVSRITLHPNFNHRNLANDIALVGLETPVKIDEVVDTVCTPDPENPVNASACLASGWGKNDLGRFGSYQDTLRKVSLPLMAKPECQVRLRKTKLGKYFTLLPGFLCAGGIQDSDTCEGDGGGPLFCPLQTNPNRFAVVGVISWGIDCGKGNPAVFADVNHYMPWIKKQIL